jgi:hypothetical protein
MGTMRTVLVQLQVKAALVFLGSSGVISSSLSAEAPGHTPATIAESGEKAYGDDDTVMLPSFSPRILLQDQCHKV